MDKTRLAQGGKKTRKTRLSKKVPPLAQIDLRQGGSRGAIPKLVGFPKLGGRVKKASKTLLPEGQNPSFLCWQRGKAL